MNGSRTSFLRVAAVCAVVSALTTLPIHLLDFPGNTFEERLALRDNPLYLARFAIIAVHVCLVVVSMLGVALVRRRAAPALTTLGFLGYVLFASVELLRQSLAFFALNRSWRAAYAAPGADDATRAQMETLLAAWPGINDALFHLFIFGFTAGTACYAAALLNGRGLQRATGAVPADARASRAALDDGAATWPRTRRRVALEERPHCGGGRRYRPFCFSHVRLYSASSRHPLSMVSE